MNALVYEYFLAKSRLEGESLFSEGYSMLRLIAEGLSKAKITSYPIINDSMHHLKDALVIDKNTNPISFIREKIGELDIELFYPIAPDWELASVVSALRGDVEVIASDVDSIKKTADKWLTYKHLEKEGIAQPATSDKALYLDNTLVKPRFGAGCEGIMFNRVKQKKDEYIMQEYIEGVDASVSLFSNGAESMAVSLNKQKIIQTGNYLNYCGGVVPLKHVLRDEAFQLAEKAVDAIGGLKGCIGVDMILSDKPYVVEINPRVTTSMTALQQAADFNVAYRSLKAYQGFMPDKPRFNKVIEYNITDKGITYSSQAI